MSRPIFYLLTLGCPKNQVDSRQIKGMLTEKGYALTEAPQAADIILVNTCGFVDEAKEESINAILRLARYKELGSCRLLVVLGCLAQRYGKELAAALPEVDFFFGVSDWARLTETLAGQWEGPAGGAGDRRLIIGRPERYLFSNQWALNQTGVEEPAGYVKIAEGCDNHCTFCVIPRIRGSYRSRPPEDILAEVAERVRRGMREAVLIAQDTGAYGRDSRPAGSLAGLLRLLSDVDGLTRIRIMYCYPEGVNDELLAAMRHPKVCPYLDLPLQHVDDGVLRRMGRPLDGGRSRQILTGLRQRVPGLAIRSTFMVGFPGETPAAFQSLLDFLAEYQLERVGFFAFSPQPGTAAAKLPGQVAAAEKERRLALAQSLQSEILARLEGRRVGQTLDVFIDRALREEKGVWHYEGRTCRDAPEVDGAVNFRGPASLPAGSIASVRITHSQDYLLLGEMVDESGQ
ncbi:MAG: 30S ribosomal protein S12 methylthiotransferase RimO [Peptococcaceae bacterium]|jgi:ribosomal protein S12 methylthiotransferase|nr:30S ribosomal protein S12 methylthiotransferase RimO [Peptococcaceae bacterium]